MHYCRWQVSDLEIPGAPGTVIASLEASQVDGRLQTPFNQPVIHLRLFFM